MKSKTLNRIINSLLFEADVVGMPDMVYGVYDRPGPKNHSDPNFKPTVQPEIPLKPTEMMSNQLAVEKPPIEDDEYAPTSVSDLRQAMSAVASLVPPDQVERFYRRAMDLLDEMEEEDMSKKVEKPLQVAAEEETEVKSESARRHRRRTLQTLLEAMEDESLYSTRTGERLRSPLDPQYAQGKYHVDPYAAQDEEMLGDEELPKSPASEDDDTILAQMSKIFGYSGPSGMRQSIQRTIDLVKYLVEKVGAGKLESAMRSYIPEFLDLAVETGQFSEDDAKILKTANPDYVREELDAFKIYFNDLYSQSYREILKEKEMEIRDELRKLGIPEKASDTAYYQVIGASSRKDTTLEKGMLSAGMSPTEIVKILKAFGSAFPKLKKMANEKAGDLFTRAGKRSKELSADEKQRMVLKAFRGAQKFKRAELSGGPFSD